MNFLKKSLSMLLILATVATMPISAFAAETEEETPTEPHVLQVLIVSENGNEFYTGEAAEKKYEELQKIETPPISNGIEALGDVSSDDDVETQGAFSYKYRFVPDSKDGTTVYGSYSIISDPWGNNTSLTQKATIAFTAKSSWSVNCTLTGKYKKAVEGSVSGDWSKEYSVSISHEQNVAAKKRVWLQYRPEYILHSGKAQKYYITRGTGILIVESSQDVDIREAYTRNVTMGGKTYNLPAGAYVWCEDSDYMNSKPPVVQN